MPKKMPKKKRKNAAAVALGRLGGRASANVPHGLAKVSKRRRREISAMGVAARRAKRAERKGSDKKDITGAELHQI